MMEATHTPGPDCLRHHPELHKAAQTLGATSHADAQAKARLWNAAPDLLAALEGWLNKVDAEGGGNCCGCDFVAEAKATRAAIAKAKP